MLPKPLIVWLIAAVLIGAGVWGAIAWLRALPPEHSPFAALDLERPIGWATELQLARIREDASACSAALSGSQIGVAPIDDRIEGAEGQCGFSNAVVVTQSAYPYSGALRVSCPLAAALYVWEREVVAPAAARLDSPVASIDMIGTYACRNIYGRSGGRLSEHASANAIDITGFRLENGERISVLEHWDEQSPEGAFLREVRAGGCRLFQGVLSPDYNRAHADHLHLDMGPYDICS